MNLESFRLRTIVWADRNYFSVTQFEAHGRAFFAQYVFDMCPIDDKGAVHPAEVCRIQPAGERRHGVTYFVDVRFGVYLDVVAIRSYEKNILRRNFGRA